MRLQGSNVLAIGLLALWPAMALAAGPAPAQPSDPTPAPVPASLPVMAAPVMAAKPADPAPAAVVDPAAPKPRVALNETQQYCQNIAAAAADARFAWQRKKLNDLDAQLKQRIADLEAKEATLRDFMAHRDEIMKHANETIVGIYAKMKPDAAALQIAALDDDMASAILSQLTQKMASSILNEIPPERAAKLVTAISANSTVGKKS